LAHVAVIVELAASRLLDHAEPLHPSAPVHHGHPSFFHAAPTADPYTLSLHDALPIFSLHSIDSCQYGCTSHVYNIVVSIHLSDIDRKSTRLNSSHVKISYAVFCLKKKSPRPAWSSSGQSCRPR